MKSLDSKKILFALMAGSFTLGSLSVAVAQDTSNMPLAPLPSKLKTDPSQYEENLLCRLDHPGQIYRFSVECRGYATYLDVEVADCCIAGDHWQVKAKVWDVYPNTAVASAPGQRNVFGVAARVYSYGDQPLRALVECSYPHGVNVFSAGAYLRLSSDGKCDIKNLGLRDEIDRAP